LNRVISEYRALSGEAPLFPKWACGYWQSRALPQPAGDSS
jgi:alpha-glucosidase (family GH31 glycosyl hydrolase)